MTERTTERMTERTWQGLGAAALAVAVVLGLMPILPDTLRLVALVVAFGLAVAAAVVRRRVRSSADHEGLYGHGSGIGPHDTPATGRGVDEVMPAPAQE